MRRASRRRSPPRTPRRSSPPLEGAEIGEATIDGDTATVAATSADGQEGEFTLVKEDGWKVDLGS